MPLRPLLFVCAAVLALVPGWTGEKRLALLGESPRIHATRVALDPADPSRRRVGALTFMGGVHLTSPDPAFGGFSALAVRGDRVTLLSDGGNVVRFTLRPGGSATEPLFVNLPAGPGTGWDKRDRDSEAMTVDAASGRVWVAFEGANAIWRYDEGFTRGEGARRPQAMRRWSINGGAESLVRLRDRRFVAFGETGDGRGSGRPGVVFAGDPTVPGVATVEFRYLPPRGYAPSDATQLPDGRLLVLLRAWSLPLTFASRLEVVDLPAIPPGAMMRGRLVAALAAPLVHENFEGVAATVEGGRTIVWLVSDDNRTPFERTLLLKFRLD